MNKVIGIDLDEVLSESVNQILKIHNHQINWKKIKKSDISSYYLHDIPDLNISKKQCIKRFRDGLMHKSFEDTKSVIWAQTKLKELKKKWYKLIVITARREVFKKPTIDRLDKNFGWLISDVLFADHFTKNEKNKSELCKQVNAKIMIEDNLEYAIELASNGIKVYLIDRPWNQNYDPSIHKNIFKFKKWRDLDL